MDIPQVVGSDNAAIGAMGQRYLVTGRNVALRHWNESTGESCGPHVRQYEIVGYLLSGCLQVDLHGQVATLHAGDSWLIPAEVPHTYRVLESIDAIEATSPPARFNERDELNENQYST